MKPEDAIAEITRLRALVAEAKAAGFIDKKGKMRKVLGTLPLTADGQIVGENAQGLWVWTDSDGLQQDGTDKFRLETYDGWTVGDAYVSEEAARAARRGNRKAKR